MVIIMNENSNNGITIRLSETVLAVIISSGIAFGMGVTVTNANNSNQQQTQINNCSSSTPSQPSTPSNTKK
jgi:hypothetical protein